MPFSLLGVVNEEALTSILADIPFIGVGILAFFTLSFFFAMKRLTLLCACLHFAALAAFIASVIDVSQALWWNGMNAYATLNTGRSSPGYIARDVWFGVSLGLRLLFFWFYVAEPPQTEASFVSNRENLHSGSWRRWGIIGSVFQWLTLEMIATVVVLQLMWRIDHVFAGFSPLYNASAAIEIILSAVLLLKLWLNTWICAVASRRKTLLTYTAAMVALGLNVVIGMGNLVSLQFTESVLGRSLLAFEFYSMIFSTMILTFYPLRASGADAVTTEHASAVFQLPNNLRSSPFEVIPPSISTIGSGLNAAQPNTNTMLHPQRTPTPRRSSASRVSSWIASRGWQMLGRTPGVETDQVRLWKHDEAEGGTSPVHYLSPSVFTADKIAAVEDKTCMHGRPVSPASTDYVEVVLPKSDSGRGTVIPALYSPYPPPTLQYAIQASGAPAPIRPSRSPSPVFGLAGTTFSSPKRRGIEHSRESSKHTSGISALLRKQEELDKSIVALRLLNNPSPGDRTEDDHLSRVSSCSSDCRSRRSKRPSIFSRSEISLSHFPPPPKLPMAEMAEVNSKIGSIRSFVQKEDGTMANSSSPSIVQDTRDLDFPHDLPPPRMPAVVSESRKELSLSDYDMDSELSLISARMPKFGSHGTQYDVTSFIGNLTAPGHKKDESLYMGSEAGEVAFDTVDRPNSTQSANPGYVESPLDNPSHHGPNANGVGVGRGAGRQVVLPPKSKLVMVGNATEH